MSLRIKQIEYFLPCKVITNKDLEKENPEWDIEEIEKKSGVRSRHIAETDQTALDLAIKAVEKIIATNSTVKDPMDVWILISDCSTVGVAVFSVPVSSLSGTQERKANIRSVDIGKV